MRAIKEAQLIYHSLSSLAVMSSFHVLSCLNSQYSSPCWHKGFLFLLPLPNFWLTQMENTLPMYLIKLLGFFFILSISPAYTAHQYHTLKTCVFSKMPHRSSSWAEVNIKLRTHADDCCQHTLLQSICLLCTHKLVPKTTKTLTKFADKKDMQSLHCHCPEKL